VHRNGGDDPLIYRDFLAAQEINAIFTETGSPEGSLQLAKLRRAVIDDHQSGVRVAACQPPGGKLPKMAGSQDPQGLGGQKGVVATLPVLPCRFAGDGSVCCCGLPLCHGESSRFAGNKVPTGRAPRTRNSAASPTDQVAL
jgi:hypothetical protein